MPSEHKILKFLLPASLFTPLKAGTRKWLIECPCGHKRDLWDAGGVKGAGNKEKTYKRCPACGERHWLQKRKKTRQEIAEFLVANSDETEATLFFSKHDRWVSALVWGASILIWSCGTLTARAADLPGPVWIWAVASTLIGYFPLWLWLTTYYYLSDGSLHLQSGPFRTQLPLDKIQGVNYPSRGAGISFAFSRDALSIKLSDSNRQYLTSPIDRPGFLKALAEQCPHLTHTTRGLIKRDKDEE